MSARDKSVLIKTIGERHTGTRAIEASVRLHPHAAHLIPDRKMLAGWNQARREARLSSSNRATREVNYAESAALFPNVLRWKHGVPEHDHYDDLWDVHYIMAIRHPYSWLLSFARAPYHRLGRRDWILSSFIRRPWRCSPRDALGERADNPLDLWQKRNRAFADFAAQLGSRARWLRHEDLIQNGTAALNQIFAEWGLDLELTAVPHLSTKDSRDNSETLRQRQHASLWKQLLNRDEVAFINSQIDWNFAAQFDYHPTNPREFPRTLGWWARKLRLALMLGWDWTDILGRG